MSVFPRFDFKNINNDLFVVNASILLCSFSTTIFRNPIYFFFSSILGICCCSIVLYIQRRELDRIEAEYPQPDHPFKERDYKQIYLPLVNKSSLASLFVFVFLHLLAGLKQF